MVAMLLLADGLWQWLNDHSTVVVWLFVASIGSLVLVAALLPLIVVRMPADHFLVSRRELTARRGIGHLLVRVGKNLLGVVFVLAGLAMLVLPGQGLLTILVGLLLLEFPGKRRLELRVVRRPAILSFLNGLRARRGRPPLRVE